MYNQLLDYSLLGKSYGFSSGSFSFANLVLANATNHTQARCNTFDQINKMQEFKDWKEFINRVLIDSGQFENSTSEFKNQTEIEIYNSTDKNSQTEIRVGYQKDNLLIYLQVFNSKIPGYNELMKGDYFNEYDFHESKDYGNPGLKFTEKNQEEIIDILKYGIEGEEIQYVLNNKILKSSVCLIDTEFHSHFDFTERGFWQNLFGPKVENMDGIKKRRIDLSQIFSGIENVSQQRV